MVKSVLFLIPVQYYLISALLNISYQGFHLNFQITLSPPNGRYQWVEKKEWQDFLLLLLKTSH